MKQEPYSEWLDPVPDEEREYYQHIEKYFGQRGGFPWIIRGRDWLTARHWWEEGIPLSVIYDAIDAYFEKYGAEDAPRFLGYVEPFVRRAWKAHRMAALGALTRSATPGLGPAELEAWFENWQAALARAAEAAKSRGWDAVHDLLEKKKTGLARIQRSLVGARAVDIDLLKHLDQKLENFARRLLREVRQRVPAEVLGRIEAEVRQDLTRRLVTRPGERLPARLVQARVRQKLVQMLKLPDFSVFTRLRPYLEPDASDHGA